MPTDLPHFSITLDEDTYRAVEEFRYRNMYPNRNMAISVLIRAGLEQLKDQADATPKKPTRKKRKE